MTLKSHLSPPLDIQPEAVPVIDRGYDLFVARLVRELREISDVEVI
jgi:hypothetical protein